MTSPAPPASERQRFFVLFSAVLLPMFLAAVDQTMLAMATPQIGREFGDMKAVSWLAVGYLLASVSMVPLYGRLADRFGRRQLLGVALTVFGAGSLACVLAPNIGVLIAARALQGAGGAGLMSLSHALIGEVLPPRERGRYQVYFAVLFASASLVGPVLGGIVVQLGNWRWLFAANLPMCALAGWRLLRLNHVPPPLDRSGKVDVRGGVLFVLTAGLTMFVLSGAGAGTLLVGWLAWAVPLLAVALWPCLWWVSRATPKPYLPLELLRLPVVRHAALSTWAYAVAMFPLVLYLPSYVQATFGSSASESGLLLMPLTGGSIVGSTLAGRVVMHTGRLREPPMFGLALAALSLAALALLPPSRILVLLLGGATGIGFGTVMTVTQIVAQVAAGPQRLGAAAAVISVSRNLGAAMGAAGFGAIALGLIGPGAAARLGSVSASGASAGGAGYRLAFLCVALICALGAWSASRLPRDRLPHERQDV